ncbi:MAG: lytic transglycosylase domain-containing protein [Verrucomicrobiota bacterium]|nr:lytic transglycosylase domain-containing protein [Verrucomicrobiota bacterium]
MIRLFIKAIMVLILAAAAAAGLALYRSGDPLYVIQEWLSFGRYHRYDPIIRNAARKSGVDPMLIKAIVWRESSFHADKVGKDGERGLMQVGSPAAKDWAQSEKIETFAFTDLFDAKTNIDAGTWYLKKALQRWAAKDDPVLFALAEYNAGKSRVDRWLGATKMGDQATASDLRDAISFPSTQNYVETILLRYQFYKRRGRM